LHHQELRSRENEAAFVTYTFESAVKRDVTVKESGGAEEGGQGRKGVVGGRWREGFLRKPVKYEQHDP
jgi:hypothetical protein